MSVKLGSVSGAVLIAFTFSLLPAIAGQITEREKRDCPNDYHKFCNDYGLGTEGLRACMSRNIKKVSHACVAALVDAGEMTLKGKTKVTKKAAHKKPKKKKH